MSIARIRHVSRLGCFVTALVLGLFWGGRGGADKRVGGARRVALRAQASAKGRDVLVTRHFSLTDRIFGPFPNYLSSAVAVFVVHFLVFAMHILRFCVQK